VLFLALIAIPGAAQNPRYGVVPQIFTSEHAEMTSELGTGSIRLDFNWYAIEPVRGVYVWTDVDNWLNEARRRGLHVLASLAYTPGWSTPCAGPGHCMPTDATDWKEFVKQVIAHCSPIMGDQGIVYGVWNEPNGEFLNNDQNGNNYQVLFSLANDARNETRPAARLAGPEVSDGALNNSTYYTQVMAKIRPYMRSNDVVTAHWYPTSVIPFSNYVNSLASEAGGREIWITETGSNTPSDAQQQSEVASILQLFDSSTVPTLTRIYYWHLQADDNFSLFRPGTWERRPAFNYFHNYTRDRSAVYYNVSFQASNGMYMVAEGNGPGVINANSTIVGAWESFRLMDANGGVLHHGDPAYIQTTTNWVFTAYNGGGSGFEAVSDKHGEWQRLRVLQVGGSGEIRSGDSVALQTYSGQYVRAVGGGGQVVDAAPSARGSYETFVFFTPPPTTPISNMQQNSAIRNCTDFSYSLAAYLPGPTECYNRCSADGANACEWEESSRACFVEFGSGCTVQGGFGGWWAAVLSNPEPPPPAPALQSNSAVRGCDLSWWNPVYKPDQQSCSSYCVQNGANACEWEQASGGCYVEFGQGCYVEGGYGGWWAAVYNAPLPMATNSEVNLALRRARDPWRAVRFGDVVRGELNSAVGASSCQRPD
jgi:hypothetical protein